MTQNNCTYISILRGINVGGRNSIKMDALRQMYSDLGYTDVQSYIQSGNVLFRHQRSDTRTLEQVISRCIAETFGINVPVLVLTIDELRNAINNNPFTTTDPKDPNTIHLNFLSEMPDTGLVDKITPERFLPDEFRLLGKVIYLHCPNGYGNTKLNNTFFEKKLKIAATCRNLKTTTELLAMADKL